MGGRPKGLSKKAQHTAIIAEKLYQERELTVKEICEQLSISNTIVLGYHRFAKDILRFTISSTLLL